MGKLPQTEPTLTRGRQPLLQQMAEQRAPRQHQRLQYQVCVLHPQLVQQIVLVVTRTEQLQGHAQSHAAMSHLQEQILIRGLLLLLQLEQELVQLGLHH